MIDLINVILIVMGTSLFVMLYLLLNTDKKLSWFKNLTNQPIKYVMETSDPTLFNDTQKGFCLLSFNEKLRIIQSGFGRPVRIISGLDREGAWLEAVTFYEPVSDSDINFHYEQLKRKDKSVGGLG
ncbi:MAG: hypothetical protein ABH824_04285 [Nanoarchaeota archaeon]